MSRTAAFKLYYYALRYALPASIIATVIRFHISQNWLYASLSLALIPGQILGHYWKNLSKGLYLLQEKKYAESCQATQAFLAELQARPWLRHMIWLGMSSYSRDAASLAYNNLGAAEIGLGILDSARSHLEESIRRDPLNPLPFNNLSVLAGKLGNKEEALLMKRSAVARGLTFGATDKTIMESQKSFAQRHGGGLT